MVDRHDIRSKPSNTGDLQKRILPLERIHAGAVDDLALLPKPENKHPDPTTPHDIGSLGYRSLISSLNLERKVLLSTDAMHPSTFRNNALKNLEKVQEGQKKDIEDIAGRLGRNVVGEDFGEGSFAFKLDDGNVQFAKDLKQLSAYLDKEKGFKISEGELDRQLQKGSTVNNGEKKVEIRLLAADGAAQQLRNEVDHLEQRKDALAAAYWPNVFKGERVYTYKKFKVDNDGKVGDGFQYSTESPDTKLLSYDKKVGDKTQKIHLEPAKLYDAVNDLERVCKQSIKELHEDLRGIKIASNEVYAHKFRGKVYFKSENSELGAGDLEKLRTQGLYIPQRDIDDLKNAGALEEGDKPERVGSEVALRELRELQEQKKNIKDMAKRLDPEIFIGAKDVDKWEGLIACRIVDPTVQNNAVTDNNVRLAENPRGIADDLKIPEENRDKFCADLVEHGYAEYNGKRIEVVEWGQAGEELKNEVGILKQQCQDLMVKDWGEAYKDFYHYTKDGGSNIVKSKKRFIELYSPTKEEIAKMDAGELIEPFKDGEKLRIEAFRLRKSKKLLEESHETRKEGIKKHLRDLTGISIPANSEVYAWKIDDKLYITGSTNLKEEYQDLERQGLKLSREQLEVALAEKGKVELVGLMYAQAEMVENRKKPEKKISETTSKLIRKDISLNVDLSKGGFISYKEDGLVQLAKDREDIADRLKVPSDKETRDNFYAELDANGYAELNGKRIEIVALDKAGEELGQELKRQEQMQKNAEDIFGPKFKDAYPYNKDGGVSYYSSIKGFKDNYDLSDQDIVYMYTGEKPVKRTEYGKEVTLEGAKLDKTIREQEEWYQERDKGIRADLKDLTGIEIDQSKKIYAYTFKDRLYVTEDLELTAKNPEILKKQGMSQEDINALKNVDALPNDDKPERVGLKYASEKLKNYKQEYDRYMEDIAEKIYNKEILRELSKENIWSNSLEIIKKWKTKQTDRIKELEKRHSKNDAYKDLRGDDLYSYEVKVKVPDKEEPEIRYYHYESPDKAAEGLDKTEIANLKVDQAIISNPDVTNNPDDERIESVRYLGLDQAVDCLEEHYREPEKKDNIDHIKRMATRLGHERISVDGNLDEWEGVAFKLSGDRLSEGRVKLAKDQDGIEKYLKTHFEITDETSREDKNAFDAQLRELREHGRMEFKGEKVAIEMLELHMARKEMQGEVARLERRKSELATAYWPSSFEGKQVYAYKRFKVVGGGVGATRVEDGFVYRSSLDATKLNSDDAYGNRIELEPAKLDNAVNDLERCCELQSTSIKDLHKDVKNIEILDEADFEPEVVYAYEVNKHLYITGNPVPRKEDLVKLRDQGLDVPPEDINQFDKAKRIGLPEANQKLEDQKMEKLAEEVGEGKYAYRVTIFGKPGGIRFYESPTAMADDWGIPSDKRVGLDKGKHSYDGGNLKLEVERLSSEDTIEELDKQKYSLFFSKNEVESAIEDIMKKDLREKLKNGIVYEYRDSDRKLSYHVGNSTTAKAYFDKDVYPNVKEVEKNSVRASILREGEVRWLTNEIQIYQYEDRICATADPEMARGILEVGDADLKPVDRSAWDRNTLKLYRTETQAFNQLQTLMERDLGHKPEVIFAYQDQKDATKRAVALTREEIAEKLLPENKKFSMDNLTNKKKKMLEELKENVEPLSYSEALRWYQEQVYIRNRYEEVNDKDLDGQRADPDHIYGCEIYIGDSKVPVFKGIAKDRGQMEGRLSEQDLGDISLSRVRNGKFVDNADVPILKDGKQIRIEVLGPEGKIDLLAKLEKERTDNIKRDHKFVYGRDIDPKENVGGFIVQSSDKSEKFYPADEFSVLIKDLRSSQTLIQKVFRAADIARLEKNEPKVSDEPYKLLDENGETIEVRRAGLECTEEKMQKAHIMKLASNIYSESTKGTKIDGINPLGGKEEIARLGEIANDYATKNIDPLQKEIYNEVPDPDAKPEDRCVYLVGNVPYTRERFLRWAAREGREGVPKTLAVGDPSYEYTTKSGVRYEIKRLGLEQTEQELKKSQEKIYRRLEQLLRLPKTDKKYRTYRLVREVADDEGHWKSDYSTIEISDNTASLEEHIKNTHFKDKDVDLDVNLDGKLVGESVEYTSKDVKVRMKVERVAENEACAELDKEERKHIKEISDLQKQLGKPSNEICGGKDVSRWKDRIFPYQIILDGQAPVLQVAESPSEMAMSLAARGIKDKDGIAKMKEGLSNIYDRNNTAENYEFSAIIGKDGKQIEVKYIVEKVEISKIKAKLEQDIINTKNEITKCLPLYEQENPWNYNKIYAGKPKDWRDVCFAEVDGKLRFGESLQAIKTEFPGKEYKTDISPYAALQKLKRLTQDHRARITLMEHVYNEQRERVKQAFPHVFNDPKLEIGYRFKFLSAEEHYDFVVEGRRYIGASLTEAAEFLGVKRKQLEKLAALSEVDKDGYFIGSSSKIKRRQVDSDTVEVVLANRDQWKTDPMHMFKDAKGKVWFTDEEHLDDLPEFKDKSMVRISEKGINIRNVVNPNPLAVPQIRVDWTDPEKKQQTSDDKNSDDSDTQQPMDSLSDFSGLQSWLSNTNPEITAEA